MVLLCLILVFGFSLVYRSPSQNIGTAKKKTIEQVVSVQGTLEPHRFAVLTAPYEGYLEKIHVKIGDHVRLNDPLFAVAPSLGGPEKSHPIRASFAGVVVDVLKFEGQQVKPGDFHEAIMRLDDPSHYWIFLRVPELEIAKIRIGQTAKIHLAAIANQAYEGVVRTMALAPQAKDTWGERNQVDYTVRVEVLSPPSNLKSGLSASVDIVTERKEGVIAIDHEYVFKEGSDYFVTTSAGKRIQVQLGLQTDREFEVLSGLTEGQELRMVDYLHTTGEKE